MTLVLNGHDLSGTTANRPTNADAGQPYFDTTLGKWLVYNGTSWVDSGGGTALARGDGAANGGTVSAVESGDGVVHKTVLTLTATPITVGNTTGVSFGGVKVYDFPEGRILLLGCVASLSSIGLTNAGNATPIDGDDNGDVSLGSTVAGDGTLTGTDVDMGPSTAVAFDTFPVNIPLAASAQFDGTTTPLDMYVNMLVDDGDVGDGASDILELTGTITFHWINLGDY